MNPRFLLLGLLICFALLSLFLLSCISSWIGLEETTISALNNGSGDKIDDDLTHATTATVARLNKQVNINFLAFDFDLTIVDIHTGGRWKGTNPAILPHVRPYFPVLLQKSLDNDIHVAVVTFSTQVDLIRSVLDYHAQTNTSTLIPIRGGMKKKKNGKQSHMKSAIKELVERNSDLRISKETSLLIDDDEKNIETALRNGVRAISFNPSAPSEQVLQDIANLD